jgi:cytochrome P450
MDSRWLSSTRQTPQMDAMVATLRGRMFQRNHRVPPTNIIHFNIRTYRRFYKSFQENLEKGIGKDCFAKHFFEQADEFGFDADQKMFAAGSMIEAGSDTTRNQNNILMANAAHDPSWIPKVRAQLDEVCGANAERLPEYTDWEKLPWIHATIKETLRFYPNMVQLGAPHAVTYRPL